MLLLVEKWIFIWISTWSMMISSGGEICGELGFNLDLLDLFGLLFDFS